MRSLILSAGLLGTGALALSASPAAAAGGPDALTCAFRGIAGMASPGVETVQQDAFDNSGSYGYGDGPAMVTPGVLLGADGLTVNVFPTGLNVQTGGTGTGVDYLIDRQVGSYSFGGSATCAHLDIDDPDNSRVETVDMSSSGKYSDTICGTGTAWSNDQTTFDLPGSTTLAGGETGLPNEIDTLTGLSYNVNFVDGQGVMIITKATFRDGQTFNDHPSTLRLAGSGYVNAVPHGPDPTGDGSGGSCTNDNVSRATFTGAFTLAS